MDLKNAETIEERQINRLIDFYGMSTHLELFYTKRFGAQSAEAIEYTDYIFAER